MRDCLLRRKRRFSTSARWKTWGQPCDTTAQLVPRGSLGPLLSTSSPRDDRVPRPGGRRASRLRPGRRPRAAPHAGSRRRPREPGRRPLHHDAVDLDEHRRGPARAGRPAARASCTRARSRPARPRTRRAPPPAAAHRSRPRRPRRAPRGARRGSRTTSKRGSSPTPRSSSTRVATDSADVDTATQWPSAHWYVPRGTEYGMPDPRRGWS